MNGLDLHKFLRVNDRLPRSAHAHISNPSTTTRDVADCSPVPADGASPRFVSEDRRNHTFRSLVSDIAERLSDSDIQNISKTFLPR